MIFSSLRTVSFRNLADCEVNTGAHNVFLAGENGQGKTNFLEAVYFCCFGSSFRGVRDSEMARNGIGDFSAAVQISGSEGGGNSLPGEVFVKSEKGKKTILIHGKKAEDRKELLSVAPCIVFCHEDMDFISGSPERRRWFFDQALSLYDPVYLDDLRRYRQVLKTRNAVLRDYTRHCLAGNIETLLDALDIQFVQYGVRLIEKRSDAARLFSDVFTPLYREVSGIDSITVRYIPSWKTQESGAGPDMDAAAALAGRRSADMEAGISLSGPHRDRYVFLCGSGEFTAKASTGQRRLLALLLRLAQARRFLDMTGRKPILLLDDVLLEMDGRKREKFLSVIPGYNQAFFTFLPEEPFQRYQNGDTLVYHVNGGVLS
ncbi:MAG: DNA replication and repair protein RecF [Treponema sp.]|nr:DNA replication and repair protein RecF [Treponema sp.]